MAKIFAHIVFDSDVLKDGESPHYILYDLLFVRVSHTKSKSKIKITLCKSKRCCRFAKIDFKREKYTQVQDSSLFEKR